MTPRTVVFFNQSLAYGGDDTILIETILHWPDAADEKIVVLNAAHPGMDSYARALAPHARIVILDEKTVEEGCSRGPFAFAGAVLRIRKFIRALAPDAILASSGGYPPTSLLLRFLCAAALERVPRRLLAVHNYPPSNPGALRGAYLRMIGRFTPQIVATLTSVSRDCANAISVYSGAAVDTILNGISSRNDHGASEVKRRLLGVPDGALIGSIGNLESRKGFEYLVRAMPSLPGTRLVIIGRETEPGHQRKLARLIEELGLGDRVVLKGFLADAGRFAECFDLCVIPSVTHESFGLLTLDAMQYAKPVIATRVGGLPEVVDSGVTGLIVQPRDDQALAQACARILGFR